MWCHDFFVFRAKPSKTTFLIGPKRFASFSSSRRSFSFHSQPYLSSMISSNFPPPSQVVAKTLKSCHPYRIVDRMLHWLNKYENTHNRKIKRFNDLEKSNNTSKQNTSATKKNVKRLEICGIIFMKDKILFIWNSPLN